MQGFLDCHMRATSISSTSTSNSTFFACWQPDKERGLMVLRKTRRLWTEAGVVALPPGYFEGARHDSLTRGDRQALLTGRITA